MDVPKLRVLNGQQRGMSFPLVGQRIVLGRDPGPGIQIQDNLVSRRHCTLSLRDGEMWIDDLDSTNGTFVNGERIIEGRRLHHGDEIRLGATRTLYAPAALNDDTISRKRTASLGEVDIQETIVSGMETTGPGIDEPSTENLRARHLSALLRWSERLREINDAQTLCRELCHLAVEIIQANRAVVLLQRLDHTASLVPTASVTRDDSDTVQRPISQTLLRSAIAKRGTVLSISPDDGLAGNEPARQELGPVICSPMINQGHVWGALHVDRLPESSAFSEQECDIVSNLAHQSAAALATIDMVDRLRVSERQGQELNVAGDLQARLFPRSLPELPGNWCWSVTSQPAREVGGDYHDAWQVSDHLWGIAVGDVSGKGVPAALVLSGMRAYLRAEATHTSHPAKIMARLNNWLHADTRGHMFMTMVIGLLDTDTGRFIHCNAGHPSPLLMRSDGECESTSVRGLMLGVQPDTSFEECEFTIGEGEKVLLYTDGATDTFNSDGERLGESGLRELAQASRDHHPAHICQRLWEAARSFGEGRPQSDDFTVFVAGRGAPLK